MAGLDAVPFLGGFLTMDATNRAREGQQMQQLGQFQTLQGAMEDRAAKRAALEREAAFRAGIRPDMSQDELLQHGIRSGALSAKDTVTTLQGAENKRLQVDANKSIALDRLNQQVTAERHRYEVALKNATTLEEKNRIMADANQALNRYRMVQSQIQAGNLNYNTGQTVDLSPLTAPFQPPAGNPPAGMVQGQAPNEAAAVAAINAGGGRPMSIEIAQAPSQPTEFPTLPYPATPAPAAAAPAPVPAPSVQPADAANLDARDLQARAAVPVAAPAAPVAPTQGVPGVRNPMPPDIASAPRKVQDAWKLAQAKSGAADVSGDLTPEAIRDLAIQSLYDPKVLVGFNRDTRTRKLIQNEATRQATQAGATSNDIASGRAGFKADSASLSKLTQSYDAVTAFEKTAIRNGERLLQLADKVDTTGVPVLEKWIRAGRQATGDPDVAMLNAQMQVYRTEAARILTNPNLTGQLTDSARHEVEGFLSGGASAQQIRSVVSLLKNDFENRKGTLEEQIRAIRNRMRGRQVGADSERDTGTPAPAAGVPKVVDFGSLK